MGWIGKLFKIILFIIIVGILAGVGFIVFANPNSYKEKITHIIQTYTGLPFKINGNIDWVLRPEAIFKLHDVTLDGAADSKNPAIQIKDMIVKVDLASAFKNNLIITDISINNPVIDWLQTKAVMNSSTTTAQSCTIEKFALKNGTITIQDPDDNINWLLQNVSFTAGSFMLNAGQELPALQLEGDLTNVDQNTKYSLETTAKFDLANHVLTLDPLKMIWNDTPMQGTAIIKQFDTDPVFSGNFAMASTDIGNLLRKLDPYFANSDDEINNSMQLETAYAYTPKDKVLDLTKLSLQIDKGMMTGDVKLGFISPYHAEFNLSAENFNFTPLSLLGSALFPSVHTMTTLPSDFLKQIVINGKFTGTQLSFNDALAIDQIQMEIKGQSGVVQFMPVLINAYGGTHDVALHIDVNGEQPTFQLTEQANKVNLEPWLKIVDSDKLIDGSANLKASLQATGDTLPEIKQSISGGISLFINDGSLYGVDATRLMQFSTQTVTDIFKELSTSPAANMNVLAIKQSTNWIQTQTDHPKTKFDHFELNVEVEKGVSKKATIALNNNVIDLKGSGSFVLSDQTLNFDTTINNRIDMPSEFQVLSSYIKGTPLSMTINGTLNSTTFGPNVQGFVTTILKSAISDIQTQALTKMLAATPPNDKTDKTPTELFLNSLQSLNR